MAKSPEKKKISAKQSVEFDLDKDYSKYYWLIIPISTLIYFGFSYLSNGFYQDDEVGHYLQMKDFWSDPWIFMSNWGKPGWKILLVVPSLLGYKFVLLVNSLIAGFTAYFTILLSKEMKLKNSFIAGALFALQPLVLQMAFRSYAELFTALLLVLTLYFYYKDKFVLSAIMCGWAFTVRQESALLCLILGIFLILNKKYIPVLFLATLPCLLNLIGFLHTGDYLWAWTQMKELSDFNLGIDRSFFHYFEVLIYIIGPVTFTLFLIGVVKPIADKQYQKEFIKKDLMVYLFFFVVLLFQCYLVAKGTNPGSWRYLLQVSPFAAIIGLIGFNETLLGSKNKYVLPALIASFLLTFIFFSKEATGLLLTDKTDYSRLIAVVLLAAGAMLFVIYAKEHKFKQFALLAIVIAAGYTYLTEKPKQQSVENTIVSQVAEWYNKNPNQQSEVFYDHSLILFYGNIYGERKKQFKILNSKSLNEAPKGSLIIWDSHYSYNPNYSFDGKNKNDVQLEMLQDQTKFKSLTQLMSPDKRFGAFVFEKL